MIGIHTIEVSADIYSYETFSDIYKSVEKYARKYNVRFSKGEYNLSTEDKKVAQEKIMKREPAGYRNEWNLSVKGLHIELVELGFCNKNDYILVKYAVSYRLNPTILLGGGYTEIFNGDNTQKLLEVINTLLKSICEYLPPLECTRATRIDYSANISLPSVDTVRARGTFKKDCSLFNIKIIRAAI